MEHIQPTLQNHLVGQTPMTKLASNKRLLLINPYPRNNADRVTASERCAVWFSPLNLRGLLSRKPRPFQERFA